MDECPSVAGVRGETRTNLFKGYYVKSRNIVLGMVGAGLALGMVAAPAASADTESVTRKSASCASPSGNKINVSWGSGSQTTTVYYNNHCNQPRALNFAFNGIGGITIWRCFVAPARDAGNKQLDGANPKGLIISTDRTC